jgi:hypothetical protein
MLETQTLGACAEFATNRASESDQARAEESQSAGLRDCRRRDGGRAMEISPAAVAIIVPVVVIVVIAKTEDLVRRSREIYSIERSRERSDEVIQVFANLAESSGKVVHEDRGRPGKGEGEVATAEAPPGEGTRIEYECPDVS